MKKVVHRSESRGYYDYGWLKTHHSFSFSKYYNPERMNFGVLRVLNDDIVIGGAGFDNHPHVNMEIVSIPLKGAMVHKDSTGQQMIIRENDVQIMTAGRGIYHSEYNYSDSEQLNFLQIWIHPKKRNIIPRYEQKAFPFENRENKLVTVISPDQSDTLWINQDAYLSLGHSDDNNTFVYHIRKQGNGLYVFVIEGKVILENEVLQRRDGMGLTDIQRVDIKATPDTRYLVMDIPLK
jgi:redox-sensitive bicupin YhaK (pirin superfamily)